MVRLLQVDHLAERKKLLVAQSEIHRQTLHLQIATFHAATARFKRWFAIAGISAAGAGFAKMILKRGASGEKSGLVSKVLSGISYFGQLRSLFNRFKGSGGSGDEPEL